MASHWASRTRHTLLMAAVVATFSLFAGATYQGVATALERREFRYPGRLVDIGGQQLHLYCVGTGSPTVVLEAPAFGMSAAWSRVQPPIGAITRVCSYDRAGLGWSEAGDLPFDPERVPHQLHALLDGSNERGPFVLVGQGVGAMFVRLFASRFPADAAALVLADDPATSTREMNDMSRWVVSASPWLARAGILRAARLLSRSADGLPGDAGGAMRAFLNRPDHLTRAVDEVRRSLQTTQAGSLAHLARGLPVVNAAVANVHGLSRLADANESERLTHAIEDAVRQARKKTSGLSGLRSY